jgi:hypothetical protein
MRYFMKKVLFSAVLVMVFFNSCEKIDTGKGDGTTKKGEECFSTLDCKTDQICVNGYCVNNKSTEDENDSFIQNLAEPYCTKYLECEPEEFGYDFSDIDECIEDFITEMTDWFENKTTACNNAFESSTRCMLALDCEEFNAYPTEDHTCYEEILNYYILCEEEDQDEEEDLCNDGEVKCENNIFMWCEDSDWKGIGCNDNEVCDVNIGCVTEDLF